MCGMSRRQTGLGRTLEIELGGKVIVLTETRITTRSTQATLLLLANHPGAEECGRDLTSPVSLPASSWRHRDNTALTVLALSLGGERRQRQCRNVAQRSTVQGSSELS